MAYAPHKELEYLSFIRGTHARAVAKAQRLAQAAWDQPDGPEAYEYHELLTRLFFIREQLDRAEKAYDAGLNRYKSERNLELAAERERKEAERERKTWERKQRVAERERRLQEKVQRQLKGDRPTDPPVTRWSPQRKESQPLVSLPVDVTIVDECPRPAVHELTSALQQQANGLIDWNYATIGSRRRRSRRYEGFSREAR